MESEKRPILQGEYKLLRVIEETKDSTLFLGQSVHSTERRFAIREFRVDGAEEPEQKALISSYFQPIAQRYMDFMVPCLTSLRDFFLENEYVYFVYDYVPGYRLSEVLAMRECPFPEVQAVDLALKVAQAIRCLHETKPALFFADMNPSNIILVTNGYVMLTDYGLGKLLTKYDPEAPRMGTVGYAAPEQMGSLGIVCRATDIYSLGVLMHQLVTGVSPADSPNNLPPIEELNIAVSQDYIDIVQTATSLNPGKRYIDMRDMVYALRALAPRRKRSVKVLKRNMVKEMAEVLKRPFVEE